MRDARDAGARSRSEIVSCTREESPSLAKMWLTCASTVRLEMTSRPANPGWTARARRVRRSPARGGELIAALPVVGLRSGPRAGQLGQRVGAGTASAATCAIGRAAPAACSSVNRAVPSVLPAAPRRARGSLEHGAAAEPAAGPVPVIWWVVNHKQEAAPTGGGRRGAAGGTVTAITATAQLGDIGVDRGGHRPNGDARLHGLSSLVRPLWTDYGRPLSRRPKRN